MSDASISTLTLSGLSGIMRNFLVRAVIFPLETIKTHQQDAPISTKSYEVALKLFKEGGCPGFYKGFSMVILKTSVQQGLVWPVIACGPSILDRYRIHPLAQQAVIGISIASLSALITNPMEKIKVLSILQKKNKLSLFRLYQNKEGWNGFGSHFGKLATNWTTFLVTQKYLRERAKKKNKTLTPAQLALISAQVAFTVSVVSSPIDVANTLKMSRNVKLSEIFSRYNFRKMYRGWPLSMTSLLIQNMASVFLIDRLENRKMRA